MLKNDSGFLKHILDECSFLLIHIRVLDFESFTNSESYKRAAVKSLEIIGEASKKISAETRTKNNHIEWTDLSKMRDVLVHQYFGIDYEIVWDIINKKIPELQTKIEIILKEY
ncbi:MAG: HepT-like ribonuclease domain-containing protein [Candidatus Heimdallarchaeaceae archaeon]